MNSFLILLLIALVALFIILFFFYLHKDQALTTLEGKYNELRELEKDEHEINRLRDDFIAMMVHELRAPLSVIKGTSDLLLKEENLSGEQKDDLLAQVKDSSKDMLQTVNDLLDISRIEAGRLEIDPKRQDINKLLEEESDYYMAVFQKKDVNVSILLGENIPKVNFDQDGVKRVMSNLLSNALKFTEPGGSVVITSRNIDNKSVEVGVSDTGRGIPEDMKGKLFNKFVQVEAEDGEKGKGSGLGLVIAKGIIEAHGGSIWIEDNKPKGTKLLFTLPLG
ncbi:sensor histidine kinase [Patescibacteria group bacterium]